MRGIIQHALKNGSAVILVLLVLVGIVFVRNFASVDNAAVIVSLDKPVALDIGSHFAIREGGKTVGSGVVTKIVE